MSEQKFISKHTSTEIEAMLDKVKQDMQTIQFTQSEINTLLGKIQNMTQPTKTSDLTNDSGFITNVVNDLVNYYTKTQTYTKEEVNALVSQATSGGFEPVSVLPTENISTSKIYLVPNAAGLANNIKDEYINLDGTSNGWELIGSTQLDLSNYVSVTALDTALLNYVTNTGLTNILNNFMPAMTAGNGISIANDKISTDNMPSTDMSEIVTPLPGVMSRRQKYSTEEQVVGEWIDSKPLYQKTFEFGTLPNNSQKIVNHSISNIDKIIDYKMIANDTSGYAYLENYLGTVEVTNSKIPTAIAIWADKTAVTIITGNDRSGLTAYVTIQYTKTTD